MAELTIESLLKAKKLFEELSSEDKNKSMSLEEYRELIKYRGNPFELDWERKRTQHLFGLSL
jgi:hypothetical protein